MQTYFSDRQCAGRYDVSRATWWRWVSTGLAPQPVRLSPGSTRWRLADLLTWESERARASGLPVAGTEPMLVDAVLEAARQ
jgi:predicted DNA-binding transcriptional regulator AlpA